MLDIAAAELARQPLELGHFEALRRAYVATARGTELAPGGPLSAERLLQILRITVSSPTLRQAAVEFRASAFDEVLAERMGTGVDDRRVRLVAAVWGALLMTALSDFAQVSPTRPASASTTSWPPRGHLCRVRRRNRRSRPAGLTSARPPRA